MKKKTCFVIMGFGIKNGFNFDDTYNRIIKPCLINNKLVPCKLSEEEKCNGFRADEISTNNMIDYKFVISLKRADIVIADISMMNNNAIYELGIRHTLKPKSTIILCDKETFNRYSFFDIHDINQITYDRNINKFNDVKKELNLRIKAAIKSDDSIIDNPVYRCLDEDMHNSSFTLASPENDSMYSVYLKLKKYVDNENYSRALHYMENKDPYLNEESIFHLYSIAKYKNEYSEKDIIGLKKTAEMVKDSFNKYGKAIENTGRLGAINYRLYSLTKDVSYLFESEKYYSIGATFNSSDLYCQRNHCFILLLIANNSSHEAFLKYLFTAKYFAKKYLQEADNFKNIDDMEKNVYRVFNEEELNSIENLSYKGYKSLNESLKKSKYSERQISTIKEGSSTFNGLLKTLKIKLSSYLEKDKVC